VGRGWLDSFNHARRRAERPIRSPLCLSLLSR